MDKIIFFLKNRFVMTLKILCNRLIDSPTSPECKVSVVIPVRNEAEMLSATLAAFLRQTDFNGNLLNFRDFEIIVLANNCTDDSVGIVKNFKHENPFLQIHLAEIILCPENANIGFVRRLLMNEAYRRLSANRFGGGIIMTTDADTRVAPDWIGANLYEIGRGADAVGGRIIIAPGELAKMDAKCRELHLKDEQYRLLAAEIEALIDYLPHDSEARHHQHFNGSFAVTTAAFRRAGGIPKVKFLEDVAFYNALQRIDARFRHSPLVKVYTSARSVGRSEIGLSYQINEWKKMGETGADFLVDSATAIERKFKARRKLRNFWRQTKMGVLPNDGEILLLSEQLYVPTKFVAEELAFSQTFGDLYEKIMREQHQIGAWHRNNPPVPLAIALKDLRRVVCRFRTRQEYVEL